MKKKPLHVTLQVHEPSVVELTISDRVQLDRLTPSPRGYLAERHGRLLDPGTNQMALPPGNFFFKTLSDAQLRVVAGGATATASTDTKGHFPDPQATTDTSAPTPGGAGDEPAGEPPMFTVEHAQPLTTGEVA